GEPPPLLEEEKLYKTDYNTWLSGENVTIRLPFEDEEILKEQEMAQITLIVVLMMTSASLVAAQGPTKHTITEVKGKPDFPGNGTFIGSWGLSDYLFHCVVEALRQSR